MKFPFTEKRYWYAYKNLMDSKGNKNDRNEKGAGLVCDLLTVCDLPTVGDLPTCFYDLRQSTSSLACDLRSKCIKKNSK